MYVKDKNAQTHLSLSLFYLLNLLSLELDGDFKLTGQVFHVFQTSLEDISQPTPDPCAQLTRCC